MNWKKTLFFYFFQSNHDEFATSYSAQTTTNSLPPESSALLNVSSHFFLFLYLFWKILFFWKEKSPCKLKLARAENFSASIRRAWHKVIYEQVFLRFICGPHFLRWISGVVPFNTWLISSWEENNCCYKLSNYFHSKWQLRPFWVK